MVTKFVQPRFVGPRFEDETLPVEVARDLLAYEKLVKELAGHLYLSEHQERERVPSEIASEFQLHLQKDDPGSARPLLAIVTAAGLAIDQGVNPYLTRARDLITECIMAEDGHLPAEFPKSLLSHFNKIGRSLRSGEQMEFTKPEGQTAVLTPERCKKLVLAASKVYEREIELKGSVGEVDWERTTFRMRLLDGRAFNVPMPDSFHQDARQYGGRARHLVVLQGVGAHDSYDTLQKIVSVDSLEIQQDYQLVAKFEELQALADGWYDGKGKAPAKDRLAKLASHMIGHFPESLALPAIVPTPEGGVLLEWNAVGDPSIDIDLSSMTASYHAFDLQGGEKEQSFGLDDQTAWPVFFNFLKENIEPRLT